MAKEKKGKPPAKVTKTTKAKATNGTSENDVRKQTRKNTIRNQRTAVIDKEDEERMDVEEPKEPSPAKAPAVQPTTHAAGKGRKKRVAEAELVQESPSKKSKVMFDPDTCRQLRRHVRGSGELLVLGDGSAGQLGLGEDVQEKKRPSPLSLGKPVLDVCAGGMHTVCLTTEGEVFTFGCNDEGALGRDTSEEGSETRPGQVVLPDTIVQISAGDSHTAAMSESGDVYIWGAFRDSDGRMGLSKPTQIESRPLRILRQVRATKIASGDDHLAVLTVDGRLFTCGNSEQGQLGRVAECFAKRGGRKGMDLPLTPSEVHAPKRSCRFDGVWAGGCCTVARQRETGKMFACGLNNYYQLGFPDETTRYTLQMVTSMSGRSWKQVAFDAHHGLAIDDAGVAHSYGRKEYGRLGQGETTEDVTVPKAIPSLLNIKCVEVSCGGSVSYAITEQGTVYSWGMASSHQGISEDDDSLVPTVVTGVHLKDRKALVVSVGGQHTALIVEAKQAETTSSTSLAPPSQEPPVQQKSAAEPPVSSETDQS